jgi:hypothetical protein
MKSEVRSMKYEVVAELKRLGFFINVNGFYGYLYICNNL